MKLLSTAALLAVAVTATPAAAQSWTGPHVGVYASVNALKADTRDIYEEVFYDTPVLESTKIGAGILAGYDFQVDQNFVIGVEADLGTGVSDKINIQDGDDYAGYVNGKLKRVGTIRARAGLAMGNTLAYATGGFAFAKGKFNLGYDYPSSYDYDYHAPVSTSFNGYTLGGGIEHRLNAKVGIRAEVLHHEFGTKSACFRDVDGGDQWCDDNNDYYQARYTPSMTSARIGLSYKF